MMKVESIVIQLLCLYLSLSTGVIHFLQYFTVTSDMTFPDYTELEMVDGTFISRYDGKSQRKVPTQSWMDAHLDQQYWETSTIASRINEQYFRTDFQTLKRRFNHTRGVHTYQEMYGCQWDPDTGATDGYKKYGYDGEDFLSLDLKNMRWVAHVPQADASRDSRDANEADRAGLKLFFNHECIDKLKKYVRYGNWYLGRKVSPMVSVMKQEEHKIVCLATRFYPDTLIITWSRDGEELFDDINMGEMLPNDDGTFQRRAELWVSPEDRAEHQFTCMVEHESFEPISVIFEEYNGKEYNENSNKILPIVVTGLICVLAISVIIVCMVRRKRKAFIMGPADECESRERDARLERITLQFLSTPISDPLRQNLNET